MSSKEEESALPMSNDPVRGDGSSDSYTISDDPARIDFDLVHGFLSRDSYWARGVTRDVVARAIANSLVFGVYQGADQVGFARVVTDRSTFAWLSDVFVLPAHRARGLGERLVETVVAHPDLRGLRFFLLKTADAHGLYERFGFRAPSDPERFMAIQKTPAEVYGTG
jgi:GNAT superfamily N-acetyltransferase